MFYAFVRACGGKEGEVRAFEHVVERDFFVKMHEGAEEISCDEAAREMRRMLGMRATTPERQIIKRMGMRVLYTAYADYKSGF